LYLITGIVLGVLCGLALAYWVFPVRYTDTQPATLSEPQKAVYRALVGRTYLYEADAKRAFSRLSLLADTDMGAAMVVQAQQMLAGGEEAESARGLALLAALLTQPGHQITPLASQPQAETATQPPDLPTVLSETSTDVMPTKTPFATFTPRPTPTARPTQAAPYELVSRKEVCKGADAPNLLKIFVLDASGNGIPGVEIDISKQDGNYFSFYTGFYPEIDPGYADYLMVPQETYQIRVGEGGDLVGDLTPAQCTDSGGKTYWGGLELKFKQK
jgi:hypothetical protein